MRRLDRYITIFLAAALLLSGCGAGPDDPETGEQVGETVWACEFFSEVAETFAPDPLRLADGRCGCIDNGIGGVVLRVFDYERRDFLDEVLLPSGNVKYFPGGGDFDLCYISASCACGLDLETGREVQLASLVNCGVDQDRLISMFTGSDGSVNCLLRGEDGAVEPFMSGEQLLLGVRMGDFVHWQLYAALFGGELVYKGWPSSDRAGNAASAVGDRLSISAACEDIDAAWSFVRGRLSGDYFDGEQARYYPLNREAYAKLEADAMEAEHVTDPETGEQVEASKGRVSINGFGVEVYAMTGPEAQALRELIGSVKRSVNEDTVILDAASEECSAYFAGARGLDDTVALIQDRVSTYVNEQR